MVQVLFEFGVLLPDPEKLLQGDGRQVRYLPVRHARDIRPAALRRLLRVALDLPVDRETKPGLIRSGARPIASQR